MKIDKETMRILSVGTRVDILKQLKERQKMPSELSRALNKNKSTVSEHLTILTKAGLVTKTHQGKKWVYYSLTDKGRSFVSEKPVEAMVMLAVAVLAMVGGLFSMLSFQSMRLSSAQAAIAEKTQITEAPAAGSPAAAPVAPPIISIPAADMTLYIGAAMILVSLAAFWIYWKKYR